MKEFFYECDRCQSKIKSPIYYPAFGEYCETCYYKLDAILRSVKNEFNQPERSKREDIKVDCVFMHEMYSMCSNNFE